MGFFKRDSPEKRIKELRMDIKLHFDVIQRVNAELIVDVKALNVLLDNDVKLKKEISVGYKFYNLFSYYGRLLDNLSKLESNSKALKKRVIELND